MKEYSKSVIKMEKTKILIVSLVLLAVMPISLAAQCVGTEASFWRSDGHCGHSGNLQQCSLEYAFDTSSSKYYQCTQSPNVISDSCLLGAECKLQTEDPVVDSSVPEIGSGAVIAIIAIIAVAAFVFIKKK